MRIGNPRHAADTPHGGHGVAGTRTLGLPLAIIVCVLLIVGAAAGALYLRGTSQQDASTQASRSQSVIDSDLDRPSAVPTVAEHHGNSPDCPDRDCIALMVNGDLLFHPHLWEHFQGADPAATDGSAFNFVPLLQPMQRYMKASDISVCEFETPIAQRGGPYTGYPVFAIPPEVADAAAKVGFQACTHATNHSWDQGAEGVNRLWDTLAGLGIQQTGSYKTEADSMKPLVIDSPTGGGKLGLVTGTVSLNGFEADADWRVDRLREASDPHHQSDIDRAVAKAKAARQQGADVVAMAMHSVQEYIDDADDWQVSEAHELADTGAFDVIYGAGCHCVQPIEKYKNTWIIYGTGNAVTTDAPASRIVNNQGMTARIQFAGKKGEDGSWRVSRIDWLPTANRRGADYRWCPISDDHPDGTCWSTEQDAQVRQRIHDVIYKRGADPNVVREWLVTKEGSGK
ncbi:metallophosphatase [Bifidobacterium primatium]|uniref:Metallophosphatase n=1 Tax=Bifidobacterium primatium TaxID=2045438 RepID=A0A2M9H9B6_9BIFI|nr:CapA family protein [Bifidobacterium primatium]PJM73405.1 metallophosphatase [Bifidobacterium primatium]